VKGVVDGIGMIIGVSNWGACVLPGDFSEFQMKSMLSLALRQQLSVFLFFLSIACVSGNEPPNVLLISIDDLNDWVGCLGGNSQTSTPNIDRLAERGVLFSNAHCQAPICNPSRTSLMLGLRPSTTGIYVNRPWFRLTRRNANRTTMSEYFGEHGYKTMTAGKIYHASRVDKASFQVVGPRPGQRLEIDECLVPDIESSSKLWDFGPQVYDEHKFGDAVTASWAVKQIQKEHAKPFFLAAGFYRPHVPFYAPQRFFDSHPLATVHTPDVKQDDCDDLPPAALELTDHSVPPSHAWFVQKKQWKPAVQAYLASVSFTDTQVGRLLDALDQSPHAHNTVVVLFSDHGFHLGEKQRWAKQSLWERSTRVPLIISVPHGLQGKVCKRPVELLSIYPTLLKICGLPTRDDLDGVSLEPLLKDPDADWLHVAMTTYQRKNHAVRSQHFRYIRYADGSEEFYDHRVDPHEWRNLAGQAEMLPLIKQHAGWLPRENATEARVSLKKPTSPKNSAPRRGSAQPDASDRGAAPASGSQAGKGKEVPKNK
jgi:arylsulfatase A-like enzyme